MPTVISKLLGQLAPVNTTAASIYSPGAGVEARISLLVICNTTGSAATFRVFHDDDGSTYVAGNALYYDESVPANTTVKKSPGINMNDASGSIGVRTGTNDALTFTLYGTEMS